MAVPENFGCSDAEFWTNPLKDVPGGISEPGIYLGAPGSVALGEKTTLPVVVRRRSSLRDSMKLQFKRYAVLHAIDLVQNRAYVRHALDQDNAQYTEYDDDFLAGVPEKAGTTEPFVLDARQRLDLPWKPAELLFMVTMRDQMSNRRKTVLGMGASAYEDPAIKQHLEKKREKLPAPQPFPPPGDPLPAYVPVDGSPKAPSKPGIELEVERVVELRPEGGATCMLKGAFLLPVGKIDLVPPDAEERHSAVVNIHFVLVGANQPSPSIVTIGAPIYSKAEVGKPAPGHFAFDLLTMFTPPEQTETYFIYVFSRDVMAGPFPVAFVGPDML